MKKITTIFAEMEAVVNNPKKAIRQYKEETGKPVIGCLPVYCPEEIVHAAGMLPVGVWGGQTTLSKSHKYFPAFACSIMQSVMEFALNGVYDDLAAVIIPAPCDTLKSLGQDWISAAPQIKSIPIVYPIMGRIDAGVNYLKTEFERVKRELEAISNEKITDQALNTSIEIYNHHRKTMRNFTKVAVDHPDIITPVTRHLVIKSGFFMEKSKHTTLVEELIAELNQKPAVKFDGKKVILTGIMVEPNSLLELFMENHIAIAGDDLAHESRLFRTDIPDGTDPLNRLARQWSLMGGCSLVYDPQKKRGQMLIDMVKESNADGVILCMMKFCDPEEFDYPIFKKELEAAEIPLLYLEIDQQTQSTEQARTRIQGFAEIISSR